MTIFGVDIHPTFQAGISIEQIAREGFSWVAVKASQGTNTQWGADARAWVARAQRAGMVGFCYHYLSTSDVDAQVRAAKAASGGGPIMLDAEVGGGGVGNVHAFVAAARRAGLSVPLVYLPRWWWQKVGSGSLAGLPPLVSSRYRVAGGTAASIYAGVPESWWAGYGGNSVAVLQFSDRATVAGRQIDVNAYRGTFADFAALMGGSAPSSRNAQQQLLLAG